MREEMFSVRLHARISSNLSATVHSQPFSFSPPEAVKSCASALTFYHFDTKNITATMKAPTPQLLRALREAIRTPPTLSPLVRTPCPQNLGGPARPLARLSRSLTTTPRRSSQSPSKVRTRNPYAPTHSDRGPASSEDTQTDFGALDMFRTSNVPAPATSIDACTSEGFHLNNGIKTEGYNGLLLVGGEAFTWAPWRGFSPEKTLTDLLDARRGLLHLPVEGLGALDLVHPKPDLLIVGTGGRLWMLGREVKEWISSTLGCRVDIMDTANAAAAYNLLATERGVEGGSGVGALLLPVGWVGIKAAKRK